MSTQPDTPDYEVLEFTTPTTRQRQRETTPIVLCGEETVAHRPKDFTLFSAQAALSDVATDSDKAMAMLQVLSASFNDVARHRVLERICDNDDPLTAEAAYTMIGELSDRWSPEHPTPSDRPVIVEPKPDTAPPNKPIRLKNATQGIDLLCTPPKDIVLHIVASGLASGVSQGHQVWCVMLFLDAALSTADAIALKHRLRSDHDNLDTTDLVSIIEQLMDRWYPDTGMGIKATGNRKQRRATAASKRKSGKARTPRPAPEPDHDDGHPDLFTDEG